VGASSWIAREQQRGKSATVASPFGSVDVASLQPSHQPTSFGGFLIVMSYVACMRGAGARDSSTQQALLAQHLLREAQRIDRRGEAAIGDAVREQLAYLLD